MEGVQTGVDLYVGEEGGEAESTLTDSRTRAGWHTATVDELTATNENGRLANVKMRSALVEVAFKHNIVNLISAISTSLLRQLTTS